MPYCCCKDWTFVEVDDDDDDDDVKRPVFIMSPNDVPDMSTGVETSFDVVAGVEVVVLLLLLLMA